MNTITILYFPTAFCQEPTLTGGLQYFAPNDPINVTNSLYHLDGSVITFSCEAGYNEPDCSSTPNCESTCGDGVWNPDIFPTCGGKSYVFLKGKYNNCCWQNILLPQRSKILKCSLCVKTNVFTR